MAANGATRKTRHFTMTQSPRNAVTRDAICTWVARLRPSDGCAICPITCAATSSLIRDAARRRHCLGWPVDPRRAPGSSGPLLLRCVCAPVGPSRARCDGRLARGPVPGACARASAPSHRVVLRRRGSRIDRQRSRPLARYRRHISHGRRQAKARRQEARRQKTGREEARAGPRRPRFVFAPSIVLYAQAAKKSPKK